MKMYKVEGKHKGREICTAVVDGNNDDEVKVELWSPKPNFEQIPEGELHYDFFTYQFPDKKGFLAMLYGKREGTTARAYIRKFGLKILKDALIY